MDLKLIGPFKQILTLNHLPAKGALKDEQLEILSDSAILCTGYHILEIGSMKELAAKHQLADQQITFLEEDLVALPGFIDSHTHICYAGNRAGDFAARNNGCLLYTSPSPRD